MFQLIIAVVALALITFIAVAMIFFGGSSFTSGQDRALYAQLMNSGSQIDGAMKLYQTDNGVYPSGTSAQQLAALTQGNSAGQTYLKDVPNGNWYLDSGVIYRSLSDVDQCKRVNASAKLDVANDPSGGCPSCTDPSYAQWPACSRDAIAN